MAQLPNPDNYEWDFEKHGYVAVWKLNGWQGWADEELEAVTEHYRERGSQADITATIAMFGEATNLPKETQQYMAEEWSKNGQYVGVEKISFVSEGITAMAVLSNLEVDADTKSFSDLDNAIEWCQES